MQGKMFRAKNSNGKSDGLPHSEYPDWDSALWEAIRRQPLRCLHPWALEAGDGSGFDFRPLARPSGIGDPENGAKLKLAARQSIEQ